MQAMEQQLQRLHLRIGALSNHADAQIPRKSACAQLHAWAGNLEETNAMLRQQQTVIGCSGLADQPESSGSVEPVRATNVVLTMRAEPSTACRSMAEPPCLRCAGVHAVLLCQGPWARRV